jgi:hypothetical protein
MVSRGKNRSAQDLVDLGVADANTLGNPGAPLATRPALCFHDLPLLPDCLTACLRNRRRYNRLRDTPPVAVVRCSYLLLLVRVPRPATVVLMDTAQCDELTIPETQDAGRWTLVHESFLLLHDRSGC